MNDKTRDRIHLIYHILVSIMLVVAGLCLMVACVDIYRSGDHPFSRQAVATAFSKIAIPVYFTLALIVVGFLLDAFAPRQKKRRPPEKQYARILENLSAKVDLSFCTPEIRDGILAEQKFRRLHRSATLLLLAMGSVLFLIYGVNPANFPVNEATDAMIRSMYLLLPAMAVPCVFGIFATYRERKSLKREIEMTRTAISAGAVRNTPVAPVAVTDNESRIQLARLVILAVAIGFIFYGAMSGGTGRVLTKAINICTECVGLG